MVRMRVDQSQTVPKQTAKPRDELGRKMQVKSDRNRPELNQTEPKC